MAQKTFTNLCQVKTRRFLFIIGLLFAVVVVFQYFELPYGTALPSSFSAAKFPVFGKSDLQNGDSQSHLEIIGNISLSNDSNQASTDAIMEMAANDTRSNSGFVSEGKGNTSNSIVLGLDLENKNEAKESSSINQADQNGTSIIVLDHVDNVDNEFAPEEEAAAREPAQINSNRKINTSYSNSSMTDVGGSNNGFTSPSVPVIHTISSVHTSPTILDSNITTTPASGSANTTLVEKNVNPERLRGNLNQTGTSTSSVTSVPEMNQRPTVGQNKPAKVAYYISEMNNMLLQSRASYNSVVYM